MQIEFGGVPVPGGPCIVDVYDADSVRVRGMDDFKQGHKSSFIGN